MRGGGGSKQAVGGLQKPRKNKCLSPPIYFEPESIDNNELLKIYFKITVVVNTTVYDNVSIVIL